MRRMDNLDGFTLFNSEREDAFEGLPPRKIPAFTTPRAQFNEPYPVTTEKLGPISNDITERGRSLNRGEEEDTQPLAPRAMMAPPQTLSNYLYGDRTEAPIQRPKPVRRAPVPDDDRRVTVRYGTNRAPTLQMRFSALGFQSPASMFKNLSPKSSPVSPPGTVPKPINNGNPFQDPTSLKPSLAVDTQIGTSFTLAQPHPYAMAGSATQTHSTMSPISEADADSPIQSPPDHVSRSSSKATTASTSRSTNGVVRRSSSVRRKPAPVPSPDLINQALPTSAEPYTARSDFSARKEHERHLPHLSSDSLVLPRSVGHQGSSSDGIPLARKASDRLAVTPGEISGSQESGVPLRNFRKAIDSMYAESDIYMEEKPMGRLADRALGIERYLEEEREKSEQGHASVQVSSQVMPTPRKSYPSGAPNALDSPAISLAGSARSAIQAVRKHTAVSQVNVRTTPRPQYEAHLTRDSVMVDHVGHFPAPARRPIDLPETPVSWRVEDDEYGRDSYGGPRVY